MKEENTTNKNKTASAAAILCDNGIGTLIKNERKKLGLTQQQFAAEAGLGLRFVKELESGKQTVRLDKVNQALAYFGLTTGAAKIDYAFIHKNTPDSVIVKEASEICREFGVKHLYVYGSHAMGTHTGTSDFDFAVKGFSGNIDELQEALDNIRTLKEIDLVNYDSIINIQLKENIDKYGRKIY